MTTWTNLGVSQPVLSALQIMYDTYGWMGQGAFSSPHMPITQWGVGYVAGTPGSEGTICGCTDPLSPLFNPLANSSDGSCDTFGCTDPKAYNYEVRAVADDGSCCYSGGCMDPLANNYNPRACYDNRFCTYDVLGCTDPTATNYDATATVNDGSCIAVINGCTDPLCIKLCYWC